MNDHPRVSVVIPTFNGAQRVLGAVTSVAQQTYKNIEIIVFNDGSADYTALVLEHYKSGHPDVNLHIINQDNQGVSAARNAGLRQAKGKYLAVLDDDDTWFPTKIEQQLIALNAAPEHLSLSTTNLVTIEPQTGKETIRDYEGKLSLENSLHVGFPPHTTWLIPRHVYDAAAATDEGGNRQFYDEQLSAGEDADLVIRLRKAGVHFRHVAEPLTTYNLPAPGKTYKNQAESAATVLRKHHAWFAVQRP